MHAILQFRSRKFSEAKPLLDKSSNHYKAMQQYIGGTMAETAVATTTMVGMIAAKLLFSDGDEESILAMRWFLLPLLGSMVASCGAILLNPRPEDKRIVVGRSIFAMAIGTAVPKVASLIISKDTWPWLAGIYVDPFVIFMAGFIIAVCSYVLSRPFVEKFYNRSDSYADDLHDDIGDRMRRNGKYKHEDHDSEG